MDLIDGLLRIPDGLIKTVLHDEHVSKALEAVLRSLDSDDSIASSSSKAQRQDRQAAAQLFDRLSKLPGSMSLPTLILFCSSFQRSNKSFVQSCVHTALERDDDLFASATEHAPEALANSFDASIGKEAHFRARALPLMAFARSCPTVSSVFGQSQGVVEALCQWYEYEPFRQNLDWRTEIVATFEQVIDAAYLSAFATSSPEDRATLASEMMLVLRDCWSSSLVQEWSYYFKPKRVLSQFDECKQLVAKLPDDSKPLAEDWVAKIAKSRAAAAVSRPEKRAFGAETTSDSDETIALSQLLDVLPDESPAFLRACLRHPSFATANSSSASRSEAILAAILEDNLPPDIDRHPDSSSASSTSSPPSPSPLRPVLPDDVVPDDRYRDAFADLDPSRLRFKSRQTDRHALLPSLLADEDDAISDAIKASILARAEADSSSSSSSSGSSSDAEANDDAFKSDDDDDGVSTDERGEGAYASDDDPVGPVNTARRSRARGAPKTTTVSTAAEDNAHSRDKTTSSKTLTTKQVEEALLAQYLRSTAVFERGSNVRRSAERRKLREQTGWSDEQIEGWRIMFERNPDKDKMIEKQMYAKPISVSLPVNRLERAPDQHAQQSNHPSSSSGSRPNGTGPNKKSSNRKAHDRRKRGNDRKMARVAPPPL